MSAARYRERLLAVNIVDAHFVGLGFRRTAILRKIIVPFLGVGKTKFYEVVKAPPRIEKTENVEILVNFAITVGEKKLKKRDLI